MQGRLGWVHRLVWTSLLALGAGGAHADVEGRVTGGGSALEEVEVCFYALDRSRLFCELTGPDGDYLTTTLGGGDFFIAAEPVPGSPNDGFAAEIFIDVPFSGPGDPFSDATPINNTPGVTTVVDFDLVQAFSISGSVILESTGGALGDVTVCAFQSGGSAFECDTTDGNGAYTIDNLPAGNYLVEADAVSSGLAPESYDNVPRTGNEAIVDLVPLGPDDATGINFALAPGNVISGTVTDAVTGAAIADASICLFRDDTEFLQCVDTLGNGSYAFDPVPVGSYYVASNWGFGYVATVFPDVPRFQPPSFGGAQLISTASGDVDGINLALEPGYAIEGTVVDNVTGAGIGNANICVEQADTGIFEICWRSEPGGGYATPELRAGNYIAYLEEGRGYVSEYYDGVQRFDEGNPRASATVLALNAGNGNATGINFSATPGFTISGAITDQLSGDPLDGTGVCIYEATDFSFVLCQGTTGPATYTTPELPAGGYLVNTFSPAEYLDEIFPDIRSINPQDSFALAVPVEVGPSNATGINFDLAVGARLSGLVTDADSGDPIEDALVCVSFDNRRGATCSNSDATGAYETVALPPDDYVLGILSDSAPGYIGEYYDGVFESSPNAFATATRVPVGTTNLSGFDFALTPGASISGTVSDAFTSTPLEEFTVCITSSDGTFGRCTNTDANGNYTTAAVAPGDYTIDARGAPERGYVAEYYDNVRATVPGGGFNAATRINVGTDGVTNIDLGLEPGTVIEGTVTDAVSGAPLSEGRVCYYVADSRAFVDCVGLASDGTYQTQPLPINNYFLEFFGPTGYVREVYDDVVAVANPDPFASATGIFAAAGSTPEFISGIDADLTFGFSLSGTVLDDGSGAPLETISVCVYTASPFRFVDCALTDANGDYSVPGLVSGTYIAEVNDFSAAGFIPEFYDNVSVFATNDPFGSATPITITNNDVGGINFGLAAANTISGRIVRESTGEGVGGTVCVTNAFSFGRTCTGVDADGNYESTGLPPGSYLVEAFSNDNTLLDEYYDDIPRIGTADAFAVGTLVSVGPGDATGINFALAEGNSISGTVTDAGSTEPLSGVVVCFEDLTTRLGAGCASTDFDGRYSSSALPNGSYAVNALSTFGFLGEYYEDVTTVDFADPASLATPVVIAGADVSGIDLGLDLGFGISGTVTDEITGLPLEGATVCVYTDDRRFIECVGTDASGGYSTQALSDGEYVLEGSFGSYFTEYYDNVPIFAGDRFEEATRITVAGTAVTGINIGLGTGAALGGVVTDAVTGAPLANIEVCIYEAATEILASCATTDFNGSYLSTTLPDNDYAVAVFRAPGYLGEYYDNLSIFDVPFSSATPVSLGSVDVLDINLALQPATEIVLFWEARVTEVSAPSFLNVASGDVIDGFVVYDIATPGTPNGNETVYLDAVSSAFADLNGQGLVSGLDASAQLGLEDQFIGEQDRFGISASGDNGSFGADAASTSISFDFLSTGDAFTSEALSADAPSLSDFDDRATITIFADTGAQSGGLQANVLSLRAYRLIDRDTDRDGIPNIDELNFGLNPNDAGDANTDLDGDGIGTLAEIQGSSDPLNEESVPGVGFLRFTAGNHLVDEENPVIPVEVERFAGNAGAVSVRLTTEDGTGVAGTHYEAVDTVISWADGERGRKRVDIPVFDTPGFDIDRTIRLRLQDATGGIEIASSTSVATVRSNDLDPQDIEFEGFIDTVQFDLRTSEDSGEVEFLLDRRGSVSGRVAVDYRVEVFGSPRALLPLPESQTGSVVWEDGDASIKAVPVPLFDNQSISGDLDFRLTLENAGGDSYLGIRNGIATVEDEEALLRQPDTVGFAVRGPRFFEPDGTVEVEVLRTGTDTSAPLSVSVFDALGGPSDGFADPGVDYDGAVFAQTIEWGGNDSAVKTLSLQIFDDADEPVAEGIEILVPFLNGPTNNREPLSIIRIFDDEDLDPDADADGDGVPDTADIDNDNDGAPDTEDAFPNDPTKQSDLDGDGVDDNFDVDRDGDSVGDSIEVLLGLDPDDGGDASVTDSDGDGFTDAREVNAGSDPTSDASVPGTGFIELSGLNHVVSEGAGTLLVNLHRVRGDVGDLEVRVFTEDASAVAGIDYGFTDQFRFFSDAFLFDQSISIPIIDNDAFDGPRSFRIRVEAQSLTDPDRVMVDETAVLIVNDDLDAQGAPFAGNIAVRNADLRVRESADVAIVWVERVGSAEGELRAAYDFITNRATNGVDFIGTPGEVIWFDGDATPKQVQIPIIDDFEPEVTEAFDVEFTVVGGDGDVIVENTYVQIVDDEGAYLPDVITSSQLEPAFEETGGSSTLSFFRLGNGAGPASISVDFQDVEAVNGPGGAVQYLWTGPCGQGCSGQAQALFTLSPAYVPGTVLSAGTQDQFVSLEFTSTSGDFLITRDELDPAFFFGFDPNLVLDSQISSTSGVFWNASPGLNEWTANTNSGPQPANFSTPGSFSAPTFIAGADYEVTTPQIVAWEAGETGRRDVVISLNDDVIFEDFEGFVVEISPLTGAAVVDDTPLDPTIIDVEDIDASADVDGDGVPDIADQDNDNDGRIDARDEFPADPTRVGDSDGDGVDDLDDAFPDDPTLTADNVVDVQLVPGKLTPSDPSDGASFGSSVAIDGATAVIAAAGDSSGGLDFAGSAYVFERNDTAGNCPATGSPDSWCETAKLLPSTPEEQGRFGWVSIEGDRIVVGAPNFLSIGAAHVFERNTIGEECVETGTIDPWCETARLSSFATVSGDDFAQRPAGQSGDTLAIGAESDSTIAPAAGAVSIFDRNVAGIACPATGSVDDWCESRIFASDAAADDRFGHSVSLDGDLLIVAADRDDDSGENSGSVYVFRRNDTGEVCPLTGTVDAWCERAKLLADDGAAFDRFGRKIALSGNTAIIGAPLVGNTDGSFATGRGAAYVFVDSGGDNWIQQDRVVAREGSGPGDIFGYPDFDGTTAVIGSPTDDDGGPSAGSAYVFVDAGGGDWQQQAKLRAPDAGPNNFFGDENAAVDGSDILVGAPGNDGAFSGQGAVYVFSIGDVDTDGDGLPDAVDRDDDNDGLSDLVENAFPTVLNRADPNDGDVDGDGDGVSNADEAKAGYRPDSDASTPDQGYVTFTSPGYQVNERDGVATVEVRRIRGVGPVSVQLDTFSGSAVEGIDFSDVSIQVDFDTDTQVVSVDIPLINTPDDFRFGIFGARLTPLSGISAERILVDESRILVSESGGGQDTLGFGGTIVRGNGTAVQVAESSGSVDVVVRRIGSTEGEVSVDYVVEALPFLPLATPGVDFEPDSGRLTWPPLDDTPRTITVQVYDDAEIEFGETLWVALSNPSENASLPENSFTYVTIQDDEIVQLADAVEPVTVIPVVEETEAQFGVRFARFGTATGDVTLDFTFDPSGDAEATLGEDFQLTGDPSLTWTGSQAGALDFVLDVIDEQPPLFEIVESVPFQFTIDGGVLTQFLVFPLILDFEDIDDVTDTDGDTIPDAFDIDDDNDGIIDRDDTTPLGIGFAGSLADLFTVEDGPNLFVNLEEGITPPPRLDQFQLDGTGQQEIIHSSPLRVVGQTLTVGITGTLDRIELPLAVNGTTGEPLEVRVRSGGDPQTASLLGVVNVNESELGAYPDTLSADTETATVVDLNGLGIAVTAGEQIIIELASERPFDPGFNFFATLVATNDPYSGGYFYQEASDDEGPLDLAFKLTVQPTVPSATFAIVGNSDPGLFASTSITGGVLTLALAENASGIADITIEAQTASGDSSDTFSVEIDPVADEPVLALTSPPPGVVNQPISIAPPVIEAFLTDTDGSEILSILIDAVPPEYVLSAGVELAPGSWELEAAELAIVSLQPTAPRTDAFTLDVTAVATEDANGAEASTSGFLSIALINANQMPDAADDDAGVVQLGELLTGIDVLGNDTGIGNGPLTLTVGDAALGVAGVAADNTLTYQAGSDAAGDDAFSYTVTDADGESATATVGIFVNDTPVAVEDVVETVIETPVTFTVLDNDTGLLNPPITLSLLTQPVNGTLVLNGDNSLTYTPDEDFAGFDTAQYQLTDGDGETATGTITLFSDAFPIAEADNAGTTVIGQPILGIDVLANDVIGNGNVTLTVELAPNSTVAVNDDDPANPVLDYLPNAGFSGEDTFFYRLTDEDGDFSIGQVNTQVSSASGIPGQNFNVVGPTPDDPLYVPDTGLRQQNEVQCAFQSDNLLRIMCAYNDWRNVEANLDGHIGISQSRDATSFFSRLAPHHNQYEEVLDPGSDLDPDLGFSADPVIASVPGGMLTGFIASFRDEDLRGTGGLYMQRWYEQNSEIGFPFEPQRELITVAEGEPGRFIDKDHMIYVINQQSATDLVPVGGTRERPTPDGETEFDRLWPAGEVSFIYSEFNGSDGRIIDFEDFELGAPPPAPEWTVFSPEPGDVVIGSAGPFTTQALSVGHPETSGTVANQARRNGILPNAADRGARILFDVLLAGEPTAQGQFSLTTPYGFVSLDNGSIGVEGAATQNVDTLGRFLQIELFVDLTNARFNVKVTDIAELDPTLAIVAEFNDVPISGPIVGDEIAFISSVPASDETPLGTRLFVEALGVQIATDSDILVTQSDDFGSTDTWSGPFKITPDDEGTAAHQGAHLAEFDGTVLAVWRRIDDPLNTDPNQTDAIMFAFNENRGTDWTGIAGTPMVWQSSGGGLDSEICPFDQFTGNDRFRTLSFPVAVGTSDGFLVFWSDRGYAGGNCDTGAARVVMSRYLGAGLWSEPVPIDPIAPEDPGSLGHQFMPAAAVAQGQVQVAWYDSRNDESRSFTNELFDAVSENDEGQRLYVRHTLDVRSVRLVGTVPVGPSIQVTQFKQGVLPDESGTAELVQLERFFANGRLFRQGVAPFLGDYIGVATKDHRFLEAEDRWISNKTFDPTNPEEPLFLVSWADNRDVRGDVWEDLVDATDYEPPMVVDDMIVAARKRAEAEARGELVAAVDGDAEAPQAAADGAEVSADATGDDDQASSLTAAAVADGLPDSSENDGMCEVGADSPFAGQTRNQNIYASLIRPGFQLSVPTPSKSFGDFQRGFVLYLQNFTSLPRSYDITILNQPVGGRASFLQVEDEADPPLIDLEVFVPQRSSTARSVYVTASGNPDDDGTVRVLVEETGDCELPGTDDCARQEVLLNASPLAGEFTNDGIEGELVGVGSADDGEESVPLVSDPIVSPGLQFPGLQFPGLQFPGLQFPGLQFPGLQFPGLQFPGLQFNPDNPGLQFPGLQFPGLQFPGLQFPGLQFPGLQFPGLQFDPESDAPRPVDFSESGTVVAAPGGTLDSTYNDELAGLLEGLEMTEIIWPVSNGGNVLNSFNLEPFVAADITDSPSQLLIVRASVTNTIINCELQPQIRQEVIVNIANPDLDGEDSGVQVFIAPGETLLVILRVWQEPVADGEPMELFSQADESNTSIAVVATSCDTEDAGVTCDPESDDPDLMPPMATAGDHPIEQAFGGVGPGVFDVAVGRVRYDARARAMTSTLTVTNVSTEPVLGQLRALISGNKAPLNADGETEDGVPFVTLLPNNNSVIEPGESVTVTVRFARGRPTPSYTAELELKSVAIP